MREIRDRPPAAGSEPAERLRSALGGSVAALERGLPLRRPAVAGEPAAGGAGHFHLAPELFVQLTGSTRFFFPGEEIELAAGEALLLPPRLMHDERVRGAAGEPFCNAVVYAEGGMLSCHLAHEARPGRPGIAHLESRRHPQAARVHDWLAEAARLGPEEADRWAATQRRALLAAALAGAMRALDDADPGTAEPPLVARIRVMVQNQLGDHRLGVRHLAEQLGYTADHLSHVFRIATGEPLVGYINAQRMERAGRLLRDTTMAGKAIAWACGYTTHSYFIRTFRAHFGTTPDAWRRAA